MPNTIKGHLQNLEEVASQIYNHPCKDKKIVKTQRNMTPTKDINKTLAINRPGIIEDFKNSLHIIQNNPPNKGQEIIKNMIRKPNQKNPGKK